MRVYLTSTFSPSMIGPGSFAMVAETSLAAAREMLDNPDNEMISAIGHELTGPVVGTLLRRYVAYNKIDLELVPGDLVIAVIPQFRATETREFTREEVVAAGYRVFIAKVMAVYQ